MLQVTINGKAHQFAEGMTILHALQSLSVHVPALCDDPRLKPIGGCRLCVVGVAGVPRPVTACNTPLTDRMQIQTHSPEIEQTRRTNLRLLALHYPRDAIREYPEKDFHKWLLAYGLDQEPAAEASSRARDTSHPYIDVDMARCIYCYRCVRICEEVQGQFTWRIWDRGDATRIVPDSRTTLLESSCVACGACVDSCPSGALEDKTVRASGVPVEWTRTTCPYCGVGCEMNVGIRDGRIIEVKPVLDAPVNKGHLCVKGRYAFDFVRAQERVTEPMIRENGAWSKVTWELAIQEVASRLKRIVSEHGPNSAGVLGSSRATNEENYLTQKFARIVLGTNNVDCCARVCHAPSAAAMKHVMGTGAATNSFDDIEQARTILLCGANATENHPVVGARIKQARLRGANLIVIDPRKIELAHYCNFHLAVRVGTNIPVLNAMANVIVEESLCDEHALRDRVSSWTEFREFIRSWTPERAASVCGVDAESVRAAARLYATAKPAICFHGLGMTEHAQGTESVMCLINLALITGNFGKPGTGINPLRGQNNVQGAAHMGCEPGSLTGFMRIRDGRQQFEKVWNAPVPSSGGMNLMQMIDGAAQGKLKALWAIGYDIALTNPDATATKQALRSLELLIVQDMFLNATAEMAHVFLPAASSFEKDGTFMNAERRVQRVRKVLEPLGNSKTDSDIVCAVARAMGFGAHFEFPSAENIWNEVRSLWSAGAGITYERLEKHGLQWPCTSEDHPGTTVLHVDSFPTGQRAALQSIEFRGTTETVSHEFPFLLTTGRNLYQFNAGTMTMHSPNVALRPRDVLDMSRADAVALDIQDGDEVRVQSRYGSAKLPVQINPAMKRGELFATFHTREAFLNLMIDPIRDSWVDTPQYKVTAVRVEKQQRRVNNEMENVRATAPIEQHSGG